MNTLNKIGLSSLLLAVVSTVSASSYPTTYKINKTEYENKSVVQQSSKLRECKITFDGKRANLAITTRHKYAKVTEYKVIKVTNLDSLLEGASYGEVFEESSPIHDVNTIEYTAQLNSKPIFLYATQNFGGRSYLNGWTKTNTAPQTSDLVKLVDSLCD